MVPAGFGGGLGRARVPAGMPKCASSSVCPGESLALMFSHQQTFTTALLSAGPLLGAENTARHQHTPQPYSLGADSLWLGAGMGSDINMQINTEGSRE